MGRSDLVPLSLGVAITATLGSDRAQTTLTVTTAAPPVFIAQPTDTDVNAVIDAKGAAWLARAGGGAPVLTGLRALFAEAHSHAERGL